LLAASIETAIVVRDKTAKVITLMTIRAMYRVCREPVGARRHASLTLSSKALARSRVGMWLNLSSVPTAGGSSWSSLT
jgi:hypothetical protein